MAPMQPDAACAWPAQPGSAAFRWCVSRSPHGAGVAGLTTDAVLAARPGRQRAPQPHRRRCLQGQRRRRPHLLAAMAVPPERLDAVAAVVSSHPGVNHNYQREHHYNLWFVMTGQDDAAVRAAMHALEASCCRLPLVACCSAYRIDLGFDLRNAPPLRPMAAPREATPVLDADRPLAALLEDGLPWCPPLRRLGQALGRTPESVLHAAAVAGPGHGAAHRRHRAPPRAGLRRQRHDGVQHPRRQVDACGRPGARTGVPWPTGANAPRAGPTTCTAWCMAATAPAVRT